MRKKRTCRKNMKKKLIINEMVLIKDQFISSKLTVFQSQKIASANGQSPTINCQTLNQLITFMLSQIINAVLDG